MILKCLEGMYVTYTSEIFSDPRRKKKVFVEQYLGLFLAELGLFCHFVPGLLAIAFGSRLPLFIWIAGIGLGTRLQFTVLSVSFIHPKYSLILAEKRRFSSSNIWDFFSLNWDFFAILCQAFSLSRSVPGFLFSFG